MDKTYDNYTFFWSGPFSQWYKSSFVINGVKFNCAEQFMMYSKAMLFGDTQTADKIMRTSNPKEQKKLGRQVENFNSIIWDNIAKLLVYQGNMAKFTQDMILHEILLATGNTLLVEASPLDAIWGIGLDEVAAKSMSPAEWPGSNFLGEAITQVREDLKHRIY